MSAQHPSTAGRRLLALLNIAPGEARLAGLLLLLFLSLSVAVVFVQSIAFGLFVSQFGAQNLPLTYIAIAVLASLIAFVYLKLSERLAYARLLMLTIAFIAGVCALFWLGLHTSLAAAFIFLLPVWFQTLDNLVYLLVWPLAGRLFDLRQGKRLFGIVGAGNWIASIAGGLIVAPLVAQFGTTDMLLVSMAALAASALVMRTIARHYLQLAMPATQPIAPKTQAKPAKNPPLIRSRYVALIIASVCLGWVAFFFVDNIFYDRAALQFPNAVDLTAFIGTSLAITGVIALVVTTLVSSRVLQRRGLRAGLLLMPALVTACIALAAVFGALGAAVTVSFFFAALAKIANVSLGFTLSQSASNVAYQALPGEARIRVQTVAEGIVQPIAIGIAGVLLLALNTWLGFGAVRIAFVFLVLAAGWVAVIVLLAREYPHALARVLRKRQFREPQTFVADASAIDVLAHELQNPKPGVAIYAMNMLAQMAPAQLAARIAGMLGHPSPEAREAALQKIETMHVRPAADAVRQHLLAETSPQVKGAALRALASIDDEIDDALVVYLRDDDAQVAKGALVGLLLNGEVNGVLAAQGRLLQWAQSPDPGMRVLAARAIGEAGAAGERNILAGLLGDGVTEVRRAALWAAGCVKDAALWPHVIAACDAPATAKAAMQALAHGDAHTVALIEAGLREKNRSAAGRTAMADACSRINDAAVPPALQRMLHGEDAGVRSIALAALVARRCAMDPREAAAGAHNEAARMAWLSAAMYDLSQYSIALSSPLTPPPTPPQRGGEKPAPLPFGEGLGVGQFVKPHIAPALQPLLHALQVECAATKDRLLHWLALGWSADAVMKARDALRHDDAAQHAVALEVIDAQLPAEMKGWVMPALEALSPAERLLRWRNAFPQTQQPAPARLRQAIVGAPAGWLAPWTKGCALHAVAALPARACADVVLMARGSPEWAVREMAGWAGARLSANGKQGESAMLSTVERVMILKGASLLAHTPDDVLAEVAALMHEVDAGAGEKLFAKGELGDCLYVIVSGRVRIHDGARTLNDLGEGDAFGEMALLDPEPRVASATVTEQARLLRLDRAPFFDLIHAQPEVSIGIIHMLTRRLRERVQDLGRLDAQAQALAGASGNA
jgi:ATP/ADP translocase/HEAT repeat protein